MHEETMSRLLVLYRRFASAASYLQSPMLLLVRLYWGVQFAQTGWGKPHNLGEIAGFFAKLNIPLPGIAAPCISMLGFAGGVLLILGLFSRPIALLLACNMFVPDWTAEREALSA